jgi:predicted ATPase
MITRIQNLFVNKIQIIDEYRTLPKGLEIDLQQTTLLVGDQGCGKSSLLMLLRDNEINHIKIHLSEEVQRNGISTFYFDSESMNPRMQQLDAFTNPNGTSRGIGIAGAVSMHFQSHGECIKLMTIEVLKKAKKSIIFLDEPESGLSIKNQYILAYEIRKAEEREVQFIIATHSIPIIESFVKVYDLENKQWANSDEYIKNIQKSVNE